MKRNVQPHSRGTFPGTYCTREPMGFGIGLDAVGNRKNPALMGI